MHVGLLTPSLAGLTAAGSGIGVHFRHLAEALRAQGHDVTVVLPLAATAPVLSEPDVHTIVIRVPKPRIAAIAGRFQWQLHQWLCELALLRAAGRGMAATAADVWETTSTGALALHGLHLRRRAPVVTRVSTTAAQLRTTNRGPRTWISRRHEAWEAQVVRGSDAIVTHSRSHQESIAGQFGLPVEQIAIIPHGIVVPPPQSRPVRPTVRGLYVGRLEHRKGIDLLLAALPAALAAAPRLEVAIVGADPDRRAEGAFRRSLSEALQARVTFAGVVSDAGLAAAYHDADFFIGPSRYESFGLMFAEAMAAGLPVVALHAPGARDLIQDGVTGTLVPPESVEALGAAIAQFANDDVLRRRAGDRAYAHAQAHWSREALATASVQLYQAVIARGRLNSPRVIA